MQRLSPFCLLCYWPIMPVGTLIVDSRYQLMLLHAIKNLFVLLYLFQPTTMLAGWFGGLYTISGCPMNPAILIRVISQHPALLRHHEPFLQCVIYKPFHFLTLLLGTSFHYVQQILLYGPSIHCLANIRALHMTRVIRLGDSTWIWGARVLLTSPRIPQSRRTG